MSEEEETVEAQVQMQANVFTLRRNGEKVFEIGIEERGEDRLGLILALPLPDDEEQYLSFRFDFTSSVGFLTWLGHAVRVIEGSLSDEEIENAKEFLESLDKRTQAPQNRQQRRAAERREHKRNQG